jgi:hypothetical protein
MEKTSKPTREDIQEVRITRFVMAVIIRFLVVISVAVLLFSLIEKS